MNVLTNASSAYLELVIANNSSWRDAFQFGDADDTTWNLTGQNFVMDVKATEEDEDALFSLSTGNGRIVVDSETLRVIHFNCTADEVHDALNPGTYVYDLVMYDNSVPVIRTALMHGHVTVRQGITMP